MKKKELLKRIEALESIVKPIADLQKASENAKGLGCKIDLSKGPYSPEVIKYDLRPISDDVANAFLDRFKTEQKKELEVGKWYKYSNHKLWMICLTEVNKEFIKGYGINNIGDWMSGGEWDFENDQLHLLIEATQQEVEEALIKESKKRYKKGDIVSFFDNTSNKVRLEGNDFGYLHENIILYASDIGKDIVFQNGKWAEILEEKQYIPKIGDVVKAFDESNEIIIGILKHIDGSKVPYKVHRSWVKKIEPITDENIIKLFN